MAERVRAGGDSRGCRLFPLEKNPEGRAFPLAHVHARRLSHTVKSIPLPDGPMEQDLRGHPDQGRLAGGLLLAT